MSQVNRAHESQGRFGNDRALIGKTCTFHFDELLHVNKISLVHGEKSATFLPVNKYVLYFCNP